MAAKNARGLEGIPIGVFRQDVWDVRRVKCRWTAV